MKKMFIALFAVAMIGGTLVSCKKEKKAVDCTSAAKNFANAMEAYGADGSAANCKNAAAAFKDYINSDCITGEAKATLQAMYSEGFTCE
jgi:uncharacterized protein YccT (UPF0319 family)